MDAATASPQASVRQIEHGDASELPEVSWTWRRWFVFSLTAALILLLVWITQRVNDTSTLRSIAFYSQLTILLLVFVYVAGATATDVVKLVAALRSTRKETVTTADAPSIISTSTSDAGSTASAASTPGA